MALPSPLIPDANQWIAARRAGYEQGNEERRRNLLLEAGALAAASPAMSAPVVAPAAAGGMNAYSNAISSVESGGRYDAIGPATRSGDRAYGKYQVMGANIPAWTRKHLGRELTPQQFLADKDAQEKVFAGEFGGYVQKYGNPQDAASMWFSGRPAAQGAGRNDGYTSQPEYLRRFNAALGGGASAPVQTVQARPLDPDAPLRNASNALLRGGELQAGLGLQNQLFERSEKARAQAEARRKEGEALFGELALRADTPEKWARAVEMARQGGLPVAGLEDFSAREFVIARAGKQMDYMSAGKRVFNKTLDKYVPVDPNDPTAGQESEYNKNIVMGSRDGQTVPLQFSDQGTSIETKLPPGVTIGKDPVRIDTGTEVILLDPVTRQRIGSIPKDVFGEAAAKKIGEMTGQARVDLPKVESAARTLFSLIDQTADDKSLSSVTGPLQGRTFNLSGGAVRAQSRINQLTGQAFLQAFEELKGAGQITEKEGEKATQAKTRLGEQAVGDADYRAALKEFRDEVVRLVKLARQRAAGPQMNLPAAPPATEAAPESAPTDALDQARAAIDRGADRNAVIQRLRENGIDPSGL